MDFEHFSHFPTKRPAALKDALCFWPSSSYRGSEWLRLPFMSLWARVTGPREVHIPHLHFRGKPQVLESECGSWSVWWGYELCWAQIVGQRPSEALELSLGQLHLALPGPVLIFFFLKAAFYKGRRLWGVSPERSSAILQKPYLL